MSDHQEANIFCVRAQFGTYCKHFIKGGYVAIGWMPQVSLNKVKSREDIYPLYQEAHPEDSSNVVVGQQVGQISRFLFDICEGDYVVTPAQDTEYIYYGIVQEGGYFYSDDSDGCPFKHRKRVKWVENPIQRNLFSVPFQNTIRSSLTVFGVSQRQNFFNTIGKPQLAGAPAKAEYDYYQSVLDRILELDDKEFEILITHILTALGFESSEHTGRVGDGGVDARGELNVSNIAKVKLFVQAKRYNLRSRISANDVKALRANIPTGGQGAFITTADFQKKAKEIAIESGFPRIGLIDGKQLVDILSSIWEGIPVEFQKKLELQTGLIPA